MNLLLSRLLASRWLPAVLLVSLAGNMFLGGAMFAGGPRLGRPPDPIQAIERLAATLSQADAAVVRRALDAHRSEILADHEGREVLHHQVRLALLSEPFDPQALSRLLEAGESAEQAMHERWRQVLVDVAAALSPEGRRKIVTFGPPGPPPGPPPR
jgi:uncharacterized membrane protein